MELFATALVVLIVGFFAVGMRAFKAQNRLQACIDNGNVQFDGCQILPSEGIKDSDRAKIEYEIRFYIKAKRTFTTLGLRLYPKNSA
ncbi:hypothetical protein [Vibrio coralliilyticus]|uniref:DUF3301 domain-containing protein n=1 Tax=Vibrio coralliilyticus TaxID=190893 RepID=A0AAP6ZPY7_9VIBR|nr:hypothetical protein [Vibrio coralliilyticus]NOI31828.1 hypothetical protein [Vibrio coralliilyticus]NOJ25272.1 hypothetical protein [Vibrio coralliilyticus]